MIEFDTLTLGSVPNVMNSGTLFRSGQASGCAELVNTFFVEVSCAFKGVFVFLIIYHFLTIFLLTCKREGKNSGPQFKNFY